MSNGAVLGFECEWFDPISGQIIQLFLKYFLDNNTIELVGEQRTMLARIYYPSVQITDLFLGNSITVYNRLITIKQYANVGTSRYMESREVHFLIVANKRASNILGNIFSLSNAHKLKTGKMRSIGTDMDDVNARAGDYLIQVVGYNGKESMKFIEAVETLGSSVRCTALPHEVVTDVMTRKGAIPVPDDEPVSLCLIKPHLLRDQAVGDIINKILDEGYGLGAIYSTHLTNTVAEELFDVYREVYPKYTEMIEHLTSSPCLALMITSPAQSYGLVPAFREFVGPLNPELATKVRSSSLRATFGTSYECNAVHCTDLPEDAHMECKYFFETLAAM